MEILHICLWKSPLLSYSLEFLDTEALEMKPTLPEVDGDSW